MRSRSLNILLITLVVTGLLCQAFVGSEAAAVFNDSAFVWDVPVKITPTARPKPNRQRTAKRIQTIKKGVEEAPLLTLKYRLLRHGDGDRADSINPSTELSTGEQLKLAVTTNQDGFLYVVHRSVDLDGRIIDQPRLVFPDPRIKGGKNEVARDREYTVPADCREFDDPEDCWWELTPPAGREIFTVIFSRDEIRNLPPPGSLVDLKELEKIKSGSGQTLRREKEINTVTRKTLTDGIFVQNTNPKDNEEIFETVELNHKAADPDEQLTPRAMVIKNRADGVRVIILKDGAPINTEQVFTEDDELKVKLRSNFRGYVYFVNVEPGGKRCIIYPCSRTVNNEISPGVTTLLPREPHVIGFDNRPGTEVFQVIVSPERVAFLDAAIREKNCCDDANPCSCELSGSAASAAAELAGVSKQTQSPFAVDNLIAVLPKEESGGVRSRGIKLAPGRDQRKGEAFVSIEDKDGGRLQPRQAMVFEMRLKHK
jgi:Domain of unknown function (DUF4384)